MAQATLTPTPARTPSMTLSELAQKSLVNYTNMIMEGYKARNDMYNKMAAIDIAYARYKATAPAAGPDGTTGVDINAANFPCGINLKDITVPIVISQVDSFVGYLADVYLSGYPLFPVISTFKLKKQAEQLQAIIDTHSVVGGYPRQLLKFFRDCVKYNLGAIEVDWAPIERYSVVADFKKPSEAAVVKKTVDYFSKLKWVCPYNLVIDPRVEDMADVPLKGEYIGYVELLSRIELTRQLHYLKETVEGYNTTAALHTAIMNDGSGAAGFSGRYYREKPQISDLITQQGLKTHLDTDWERWMNNRPQRTGKPIKGMYEVSTVYARIIPQEHGIRSENMALPQIYKIRVVNNEKLICAKRIISVYDILPILIGQPLEDGFAEQAQSIAESQIPMQEAVSTLYNIRFNAARRAVSDRGIYDPKMIDSNDVNSAHPAAKIPIKPNSLLGAKTLDHAYKSIPFDSRGTETVISDARDVMGMAGMLTGLNKPQQGEFQKGNKSVKEWNDTMAGSDNRLRLPALCLEFQVFMPLKDQLKLNIYQYGPAGTYMDFKNKGTVEISNEDIDKLRQAVLFFKIADGYIPASKLAGTESISNLIQMIGTSQILAQAYGPMLPNMIAHLAQLQGIYGLEEYIPEIPQVGPDAPPPATQGAPANVQA